MIRISIIKSNQKIIICYAIRSLSTYWSTKTICLQEVSGRWLNFFLNLDWIKNNYYCTDNSTWRIDESFGLSNIIFSKYPIQDAYHYGLMSVQMDAYLTIKIMDNINIGTFQLHSSAEFTDFRIGQLRTISDLIKGQEKIILCGDFNFGDGEKWVENETITALFNKFTDVWKDKYPDNKGYTEDTDINIMRYKVKDPQKKKQERFDKYLIKELEYNEIEIFGKDSIESRTIEPNTIWPSDHFGLYCEMNLNKMKQQGGYKINY
jgi:tyrosyl-DNA phosphodiesterase 2